jgi:K+-sensing histidine kinase KdpD/ActR/RegA family two-component response regulator
MQTKTKKNILAQPLALVEKADSLVEGGMLANEKLIINVKVVRLYGILIFAVNSFANYVVNLTYSFFITSISCLLLIATIYVVDEKKINTLRYTFVFIISVSICLLNYVEGLIMGDYLYLFVLLIISIFIFDFKDLKALVFTYGTILLCFIFIFSKVPLHSKVQRLSEDAERATFVINIFCSSIITCILSYVLLRQNFNSSKNLVQKQQFLDAVYNTSLDAVFIVEATNMNITDCNIQSVRLFDVKDTKSLINTPVSAFFKNIDNNESFKEAFKHKKNAWQGELTCTTSNGVEFPGYVSVMPFMNDSVGLKKINILDITDIKKAQAELIIAKDKAELAMNAKSKFLSNMSHELRTPLNGIIGTANLLLDEASMPEQKEHFSLLKYSSEHMLHLINDVLDFSKIEAEKMELEKTAFNIKDFFDKIQSLFASQFNSKEVKLEFDIDEKLNRFFLGDETRLSQVMSNLISNALKFTNKGKVVVGAEMSKANSKSASISFYVQDSGIGITEQQQKIIFLSFTQADTTTTRKFGGTGLGLSISKNIIELYKGELKVESKKGHGSKFYFTIELDLQLSNKNFVNENVMSTLVNLDTMKVLIAEDNVINMLVARKFLKKWNVNITEAVNGLEAVAYFKKNEYDILLIDLEMPEMDGYETIAAIRQTNNAIPVIAFTAAVYDNMYEDLTSKGFTDYIQKPFRPEDLHRKLAQYGKAIA